MKQPLSYSLIALLVLPLIGISANAEPIVHYDNLDDPLIHPNSSPIPEGRVLKLGPDTSGGGAAQRFTAGESGTVTSVTMGLARSAEPGGKLIVSIREVDASAFPGDTVGILGEIEINGLSEVNWSDLPAKLELAAVTGFVDGLEPGRDYFLVLEDQDAITDATRGWIAAAAPTPEGADPLLADWGPGGWKRPWTGSHQFGPMHLHARIEGELPDYTLTLREAVNGSVTVIPELNAYPAGTEITLTATPDEGYNFDRWYDWSACQDRMTDNPYTFTIEADIELAALFSAPSEGTIHYDNLNSPGCNPRDRTKDGRLFKAGPDAGDGGVAQRFTMGESGTVTSVTVGLARLGEPGGKLIASIHEVDDRELPGDVMEILGDIEINTLTEVIWGSLPPKLETATITGSVAGLTPGEQYFLVLDHSKDAIIDASRGWVAGGVPTPENADPLAVDWGSWRRIWTEDHEVGPMQLHARIEGSTIPKPASDPFIIATTEDGTVTKSPDLETYPVGSEVTVTAEPEEGFELVKWFYGEEEFTTNSATITIQEGVTLTPVFAKIEDPKPLQIDIEPAVAITWDSQSGKNYQIHASTNMETWVIAVDAIEGTGERLTQCFIREDMEIFYRVEETP